MKPSKRKIKLIFLGWTATLCSLFLYSFTQIDLNLTLSRVSVWQKLEKVFIYLGYFQRPTSTVIYLTIIFLLFVFYGLILWLARKGKLQMNQLRRLIGLTVLILFLAYPAFSHDIFNYIFDAKIVAYYHQNPYQVKPLDFPDDPMTRFMHWTHRPSIYPPLWIGLSLIPFVLGLGFFLLRLLAFKALMLGCYLGTIWLILRISEELNPQQKIFRVAFYAFSPLVLIESLVSAHNDGVMIFFALLGLYLFLKKKLLPSFLSWLFSIGIKYITAILFPVFAFAVWQKMRIKKVDYQKLIFMAILATFFAIFATSYRLGLQPWYLLWALPFVALKAEKGFLAWLTTGLSLGCLWRYAPFLYYGNWDPPIPTMMFWLTILPVALALLFISLKRYAPK
jgi:Gpi18-like mannosyltransferase